MKFVGVLEELFGARCKQMQPAFAAFTLDECGNERCDVGSIRIIRAFGIGVHYSISGAYNSVIYVMMSHITIGDTWEHLSLAGMNLSLIHI